MTNLQQVNSSFLHRIIGLKRLSPGLAVITLTCLLAACGDKKPESENTPSQPEPTDSQPAPESSTGPTEVIPAKKPVEVFWASLETLCNNRYAGQLTIGTEESDRDIGLAELIIHSRQCKRNAIDIGFKVDDDDSRTWMFRRTDNGLSLHHRHVDESGKADATSGYGGVASSAGTHIRQEFPADTNTGNMIPAAATNVWAVEVTPGKSFAYELQRIEEQRMFRVVFDLTNPL